MKKLKVILIDDERLAREEMKRHLGSCEDVEIVAEAANADEAFMLIERLEPDIIFLDIVMPGHSGFDLLESLTKVPEVIFTTAFDSFAAKAFEINAMDYLVKPVRVERFAKAMTKVRKKFEENTKHSPTLFVKEGDRFYLIKTEEIHLVESAGNYARLHFKKNTVLIKRSLNQLGKMLDPTIFFRVNRTTIMNRLFIKTIVSLPDGRLSIQLESGDTITASGRQTAALKSKRIGQ